MKKNTILIPILVALSLVLLFIVIARWNEANAPERTEQAIESVDVQALAAVKSTVSNADLTPPPAPTPDPTPTLELEDDLQQAEPPAETSAQDLGTEPEITNVEDMPIIPQPEQGRYGSLLLTSDELELLARIVYLEARGECMEGQQAVAEVVLNRVISPSWPGNVYDVIFQAGQFEPAGSMWAVTPTQAQYDAVSAALSGPNVLPQAVYYFATTAITGNVWGSIGHHVFCY